MHFVTLFERLSSGNLIAVGTDILAEFAGAPRTTNIPHVTRPRPKYSVKALMKNITEGELTGHAGEDWQQILHDRTKVPVKLFSFQATDRRPGYIGELRS